MVYDGCMATTTNAVRTTQVQSIRPYTTRYRFYVGAKSWGFITGSSGSSTGSAGSSSASSWVATDRSGSTVGVFDTKRDAVAAMAARFGA